VCRELSAAALRPARAPPAARARAPRVLELGCGGAPLAGLAAAALGCDCTLSDLPPVAPLADANCRRNLRALDAARRARGAPPLAADGAGLEVVALDLRAPLPRRVLARAPFAAVVCSECVWRADLHAPLARTLAALLRAPPAGPPPRGAEAEAAAPFAPPRVAVAFRRRFDDDDLFVTSAPARAAAGRRG